MDSSAKETLCKNSVYGCTFASSSEMDMMKHFQTDCMFQIIRCFKCNKTVRRVNFEKHFVKVCKDSSAPPCPAPEEVPDVGETEAFRMMSQEQHFLRECVRENTLSVESLINTMNNVAGDVAKIEGMKGKQEELEAAVKGQGNVIQELSKTVTMMAEKVNKVEEDAGSLLREVKLLTSNIMNNVAKDVAKMAGMERKQQELQAAVKGQGNVIQKISNTVTMMAEKVNKVEEDAGSLLREVGSLTRRQAGQSTIHWYLQNFSTYVEKAKKEKSEAVSDMFVLRGYSVKLVFQVKNRDSDPSVGLYFCLCRGPDDSLLQWPFRIPYTLSLVHPKDASKSETLKITPPSIGSESFKKREDDDLRGHGTGSLCTIKTVQDEGFIEDDAVCFSITLHD